MATGGIFTDVESVERVARMTNEVNDDEINGFIDMVDQEIIREHGYPVHRAYSYIDADHNGSYFFTKNRQGVYRVERVWVSGSLLDEGSYTKVNSKAAVYVSTSFETSTEGSVIWCDLIPQIYHNLATFMVAKDLIESQYLISSEGGEFPRTSWLTRRIKDTEETIPSTVMRRSSSYATWDPKYGEYIDQSEQGHDL